MTPGQAQGDAIAGGYGHLCGEVQASASGLIADKASWLPDLDSLSVLKGSRSYLGCMSRKSFTSELRRAEARDDATTLLHDIEDYRQFHRGSQGLEELAGVAGGNHCHVFDAHREDPDIGLAYLALAMANYEDADFLGLLAAGLLEDLLRDPSPEILKRILDEARKTPRFRWMLSGVWLHAIAERVREPIREAVGGVQLEDPLPPTPF